MIKFVKLIFHALKVINISMLWNSNYNSGSQVFFIIVTQLIEFRSLNWLRRQILCLHILTRGKKHLCTKLSVVPGFRSQTIWHMLKSISSIVNIYRTTVTILWWLKTMTLYRHLVHWATILQLLWVRLDWDYCCWNWKLKTL